MEARGRPRAPAGLWSVKARSQAVLVPDGLYMRPGGIEPTA